MNLFPFVVFAQLAQLAQIELALVFAQLAIVLGAFVIMDFLGLHTYIVGFGLGFGLERSVFVPIS